MNCPFCQAPMLFLTEEIDNFKGASCTHGKVDDTTLGVWAFVDKGMNELVSYFINFAMDGEVYGFDTGNIVNPGTAIAPGFLTVGQESSTLSIFKETQEAKEIQPFLKLNQYIKPLPNIQDYEKLFQRYLQLKAFF